MKKPAQAVIPAHWGTFGASAPAQPGNRPGRGKSAHAKPAAKKKPPPPAPRVNAWGGGFRAIMAQAAKKQAAKKKTVKKAKHHPKRQLALGDGVACCSAEALAASLRLTGAAVSDGDVLELYRRTAADEDAGASILATLEAASRFGLAGVRPDRVIDGPLGHLDVNLGRAGVIEVTHADELLHVGELVHGGSVILGISLPAPHAVLATADGWWSWGELYKPWTDEIDEAWEVTW